MNLEINDISELKVAAVEILKLGKDIKKIAFYGQMGAGKTTLIKTICSEMGVKDMVSSPTFSIINEYQLEDGSPVYHIDAYRLKNAQEAIDIGMEDYLHSNQFCFIEWPEIVKEILPESLLNINITVENNKRVITINP